MMTVVKGTIVDHVPVGAVRVPEGDRPDLHVVRKADRCRALPARREVVADRRIVGAGLPDQFGLKRP